MIKKINKDLFVSDTISFDITTVNVDGIFFDTDINITIYYCEYGFYKKPIPFNNRYVNPKVQQEFQKFSAEVAKNPTQQNIDKIKLLKNQLEATTIDYQLYYRDAIKVAEFTKENLKNKSVGNYELLWSSEGQKEGQYIIIWEWYDKEVKLTDKNSFTLEPNAAHITTDSSRNTPEDKYDMLMDLYMPKMYKSRIKSTDISPEVIKKLNKSVAKCFTTIENRANKIIDLLDANSVDEVLLPLLANMFNLNLKSNDSVLWRRQIKQAIPLFKLKGNLIALKEALDQAGINLKKITKLWQVTSEYYWVDGFNIVEDTDMQFLLVDGKRSSVLNGSIIGRLSSVPLYLDSLEIKMQNSEGDFVGVPQDCIKIIDTYTKKEMPLVMWQGEKYGLHLYAGDVLTIKFTIKDMPPDREPIEEYIETLPLADIRDPKDQKYPLKNWNVRLIEEDDPLFDVVIKDRHPFVDPVVYGKIRTSFAYSEKAYNTDTFDGSLKDSTLPCDIDKEFIDTCSYCQSSSFIVDVEIRNLSDDRIQETREIIEEYTPFHSILHSMNIIQTQSDVILLTDDLKSSTEVKEENSTDAVEQRDKIRYKIEYDDGSEEKGEI